MLDRDQSPCVNIHFKTRYFVPVFGYTHPPIHTNVCVNIHFKRRYFARVLRCTHHPSLFQRVLSSDRSSQTVLCIRVLDVAENWPVTRTGYDAELSSPGTSSCRRTPLSSFTSRRLISGPLPRWLQPVERAAIY